MNDKATIITTASNAFREALEWWGWIFRIIIYVAVGLIGYFTIHPGFDVSEVPFSQLTLSALASSIFAWCLALWVIYKIFTSSEIGYDAWAMFANFTIFLAALALLLYYSWSDKSQLSGILPQTHMLTASEAEQEATTTLSPEQLDDLKSTIKFEDSYIYKEWQRRIAAKARPTTQEEQSEIFKELWREEMGEELDDTIFPAQ